MFLLKALGSNGSGQLGLGHQDDVSTPHPVLLPSSLTTTTTANTPIRPTQIAAGGNHTLLLLSSSTLLSTGDASSGACGHPPPRPSPTPSSTTSSPSSTFHPIDLSSLPPNTKITRIAATWEASVLVTTSTPSSNHDLDNTTTSRVYTFGTGLKGELGLGAHTHSTPTPIPIPHFPPSGTHIVSLAACMSHVVTVLSNGEAWGWGSGRKGQLGAPLPPSGADTSGVVWAPRRIDLDGDGTVGFDVVRAVCGREFTCLFGAPGTGRMVVLGSDKWGVQTQAPGAEGVAGWREVGAGWGSVFVLRDDGRLVSWGRDDHGQMAPEELGRVRRMAVGSEHALAVTEAGGLVAWGWGEHGNCGPIRKVKGEEKGQRNQIAVAEEGMEVTMIAAGCATSWIVLETPT